MVARAIFSLLILVMYASACALPAWYGEGGFLESGDSFPGYLALFLGPFMGAIIALSWIANPCFVSAMVLFLIKKDKLAAALAGVAFFLSLLPGLEYAAYPTARFQWEPRIALAIGTDRAIELCAGYFVWVATHWQFLIGTAVFYCWNRWRGELKSPSPVDA